MLIPLVDLDFNFKESLKFTCFQDELAAKRIRAHSLSNSIIQQVLLIVKILRDTRSIAASKLGEKKDPWELDSPSSSQETEQKAQQVLKLGNPLKIGILLPDIFPESSETWVYALLKSLKSLISYDQIEIMSRRVIVDKLQLPNEFKEIHSSWNFTDPSYVNAFDLVIIVCQSMYSYMLEDVLKCQECPTTLFMPCLTGIGISKLKCMIKSELIILPKFEYEPIQDTQDIKNQNVILKTNLIPQGPVLPDYELLEQVFTNYCLLIGLKVQQSADTVQKVIPKTNSSALEELVKFKLYKQIQYDDSNIEFKAPLST